ncbi:Unknown protein sequence [Pseudomonas syringae pv. maculicola str. M6]|nr:Unknown protein sequence [Pseudomonas syringae pv. maculicola str. M6]
MLGCGRQLHGRGLGLGDGRGHLFGRQVDGHHQFAQLIDGVVDGVGNRTGEVLGNRSRHGQIAVGEVFDLVQQTHDRRLIALALLSGFAQLAVGFANHDQPDEDDRHQRQQAQHITADGVHGAAFGEVFQAVGEHRGFVQQGLRGVKDVARGLAHLIKLGRGFEDFVHRAGHELEQLGDFRQPRPGIAIFDLGDAQRRIAFQHAVKHPAKLAGVTAKGIGGLHRCFVASQYGVDRTENPLGEQRLTLRDHDLRSRRTTLQKVFDDLVVFGLQLRNGFGQSRRHLVQ